MAIFVKNIASGEVTKVNNIRVNDGEIVAEWQCNEPKAGGQFDRNYPFLVRTERTQWHEAKQRACRIFTLAEGFELVAKERKPRKPQQSEPKAEPKAQQATEPKASNVDDMDAALAFLKLVRDVKPQSTEIDAERVRQIVAEEVAKVQPRTSQIAVVTVNGEETGRVDSPHPLLAKLLMWVKTDRQRKRFPWLFGPAGSGKSTLAAQVATALGLPFYSMSSVLQKYELEGYPNAAGEFVQTAFSQAFINGGVFLLDEIATCSPEALIAFNTALANLRYNFPVLGMIEAHPDFHVIAADNTAGRGGSRQYGTRYEIESSTLDRFRFMFVDYTQEQEMIMSGNDTDLIEFMHDLRNVLNEAQTKYLATPRVLLDIKTSLECGDSERDALYDSLCSGWDKQDIRTFAARLTCRNKWAMIFKQIADEI